METYLELRKINFKLREMNFGFSEINLNSEVLDSQSHLRKASSIAILLVLKNDSLSFFNSSVGQKNTLAPYMVKRNWTTSGKRNQHKWSELNYQTWPSTAQHLKILRVTLCHSSTRENKFD